MDIADRVYEIVKGLPEPTAVEVLIYAEAKLNNTDAARAEHRIAALALLDKHAGKFKAVKFNRADLYDRAGLC